MPVAEEKIAIRNGGYTLTSQRTGEHLFIRIRTKMNAGFGAWKKGDRYIEIQRGQHWEKFGFVTHNGIKVFPYLKRAKYSAIPGVADTKPSIYEVAASILTDLTTVPVEVSRFRPMGYDYVLHATCAICNRVLKDEVSIRIGIGPDCRGKIKGRED
jgi:hypothetical protein